MYNADTPITRMEDDTLGRVSFSKHLAKAIIDYKAIDSVCIGLLGKWGSGKTSLINMTVSDIVTQSASDQTNDGIMVCRFEPWNFSNTDQLLQQFFVLLATAFSDSKDKLKGQIGEAIKKYGDSVLDVFSLLPIPQFITAIGKAATSQLPEKLNKYSSEQSISSQKEKIATLLSELKTKVLVIIDDIDRLSNDQIRQVFQLVTSVAKLPNLMYLLAFDREVVVKALEEVQKGDGESYLEKVIQIPISIPEITDRQKNSILFAKLNQVINSTTTTGFHADRWQTHFATCIEPFIRGIRDINRLCNVLLFKLSTIGSDIDLLDMVCITLIDLNFPKVLLWCYNHKSILTGEHDFSFNRKSEDKSKYEKEIQSLLPGNCEIGTATSIVNALTILFPHFAEKIGSTLYAPDYHRMRRYNQIAIADKFDRYFQLNPAEVFLSKELIDYLIYDATEEALTEDMLKYDQKDILPELIPEIQSRIHSFDTERALIWINVMFKVSSECHSNNATLLFSSGSWFQSIIRDLMQQYVPQDKRYQYVHDLLSSADWSILKSLAIFINFTELAYGRLAANGETHDYLKLLSLDELEKIEKQFCDYVKENIDSIDILSDDPGQFVFGLMLHLDKPWMDQYMSDILQNDIKALKYFRCLISRGHHSSIGYCYSLPSSFDGLYISEAHIRQTAHKFLSDPSSLALLPKSAQTAIAILEIIPENRDYLNEYAAVDKVNNLMDTWLKQQS